MTHASFTLPQRSLLRAAAYALCLAPVACDPGDGDDAELDDVEERSSSSTEMEDHNGSSLDPGAVVFRGEGTDGTDRYDLPAEAQAAMAAAEAAKAAPQFFLCPYYLSYEVIGFTELGNPTPEWFGAAAALFTTNTVSWSAANGGVGLVCGTTESSEPFMTARRFVPNLTSCVTSGNQTSPWFVCS